MLFFLHTVIAKNIFIECDFRFDFGSSEHVFSFFLFCVITVLISVWISTYKECNKGGKFSSEMDQFWFYIPHVGLRKTPTFFIQPTILVELHGHPRHRLR